MISQFLHGSIREDGRIIGVTESLAAQDIYELGEKVDPFILAEGTRMGHIQSIGEG